VTECLECRDSFYLDGTTCKQCPDNCTECKLDANNIVQCLKCATTTGFYFHAKTTEEGFSYVVC
jgi:hypothetical protein